MNDLSRKAKIAIAALALSFSGAALAQSDCVKDGNGAITSVSTCYVQPDEYYLTVYKLGLCTAAPSAPTSSVAVGLASCTTVFENVNGSRVRVIRGTSSPLTGTMTRPANGTYTHGYVIAAPQFEIKTQHSFSSARTAVGAAGYPSGVSCWSTLGNAFVYSSSATYPATCGATVTGNDVATQKMNSFTSDIAVAPSSSATFATSSGNVSAYLVDVNMKLATGADNSMGTVDRLLGIAPMGLSVTSNTTGMNSAFKVSQGSTVSMYNGNGVTGGVIYFGGGPFAVLMTLQ